MGPNYRQTVTELGSMGAALVAAARAGLEKGGKIAEGNVNENYLQGQYLKHRSGLLAKELTCWMVSDTEVIIGIPQGSTADAYAWLLGDEDKTILPKKGKYLSIPIGENLTGSGVVRHTSPRQVTGGFFLKAKGHLFFGYKVGKRGKFRPLFVLVTSVFVQGTGALIDGVLESQDDMTKAIDDEVGKIKDVK